LADIRAAIRFGIAIAAMIKMMATTMRSSIREKPACFLAIVVNPKRLQTFLSQEARQLTLTESTSLAKFPGIYCQLNYLITQTYGWLSLTISFIPAMLDRKCQQNGILDMKGQCHKFSRRSLVLDSPSSVGRGIKKCKPRT
jgi:hypothetical protein